MLSERLQYLMNKFGYNKTELAEIIGVSSASVGNWTKGNGYPSPENLKRLREIFHVSADYIYGFDLEDIEEVLKSDAEQIIKKIKEVRNSKNLTQKEFARFVELPLKTVQEIEDGRHPVMPELINISEFCGISLYELTGQQHPTTTDDNEHSEILKFAADLDNREYIKIAIQLKETGIPIEEILISRKIIY